MRGSVEPGQPFSNPLKLLKSILTLAGVRPRKRLGQNFLYHPEGLRLFASEISRLSCRDILEIGSGPGLLTLHASVKACDKRIVAVELDSRIARASVHILGGRPNVQVVVGDGLEFIGLAPCIYSNTPYNLTSSIISRIVKENVEEAVLGMQYELGKRVLASPGDTDYGRLTVLAQLFFEVESRGFLRREWFYPRPEVNGLIVYFRRRRIWEEWMSGLEEFTACLFSSRNKLSDKIVARCTGWDRRRARNLIGGDKRIRELEPDLILEVYREWRRERG
jgi:16S rRNA (adenine1518-N6/adenine1519-N6)-dimethyltransferase